MPPFEASSRKALRLIGGHTSAPVLELRTSGEGKAKWKHRGRTVIYGGNRESDNCRKLKEFSFVWPRSFTRAISCDILQKKSTLSCTIPVIAENQKWRGGRDVNKRLGTVG